MVKTDGHIHRMKRIALIWFILFSLSPCALKAVLVDSINTDFAKTLNKAQATAPINACQYVRNDSRQAALVKQAKKDEKRLFFDFLGHQRVVAAAVKTYGKYSKTHTGNSPPKYILFKRWKFDIA